MEARAFTFIFEKTGKMRNDANCCTEINDSSKVFGPLKIHYWLIDLVC